MPHIEIAAERLGYFFTLPVTNTLLASWVAVLVIVLGALLLSRRVALAPAGGQNVFEAILEPALGLMEGVFGSREKAERYAPLVLAVFFFILVSNWLGIIPGVGSIGFRETVEGQETLVPLFRSAASDLNFTLALGVTAVLLANILGAAAIGFFRHLGKFVNLRHPLHAFVGLLELISEGAKMISFSFRLFGNVMAGEVLLVIVSFLVPYLVPVPFLGLELFVGFIQALVFAMLVMVFIAMATAASPEGGH